MSAAKVQLLREPQQLAHQGAALITPRQQGSGPKPTRSGELPGGAIVPQLEEVELPDEVSSETIALATDSSGLSASAQANAIERALEEIIAGSERVADWHSRRGAWYGRIYIALGLPAAILAALAGATALASTAGRVPAGIIALISAAIGAAGTFLNSGDQRRYHQQMASQWYMIAGEAKLHKIVDLQQPDWISQKSREALKGLLARQAELIQGRPALLTNQST